MNTAPAKLRQAALKLEGGPLPNISCSEAQAIFFRVFEEVAMHRLVPTAANNQALSALKRHFLPHPLRACDATVTGAERNWHSWNAIGVNSTFVETASDALRSNSAYSKVDYPGDLKIRRAPALGGSTPLPTPRIEPAWNAAFLMLTSPGLKTQRILKQS